MLAATRPLILIWPLSGSRCRWDCYLGIISCILLLISVLFNFLFFLTTLLISVCLNSQFLVNRWWKKSDNRWSQIFKNLKLKKPTIFDIWNSHWTLCNVGGKDHLWGLEDNWYSRYGQHMQKVTINSFYLPVSRNRKEEHAVLLLQCHWGVKRINLQSEKSSMLSLNLMLKYYSFTFTDLLLLHLPHYLQRLDTFYHCVSRSLCIFTLFHYGRYNLLPDCVNPEPEMTVQHPACENAQTCVA